MLGRKKRAVRERQLKAAEEFTWVWADTANTDSYAYGASLECHETNALFRLFQVFNFENTASDLMQEHLTVCDGTESHGN
ncbi:hypothetical protein [Streptomyces malaysiensis]|uniref:Uncharacterized protein n=1 Tax=Streptomyces malaysiensis TaxID=92644 RepID=A0A7X6B0C1_STRMQ|nr:hypothetical protein [Streptomyces malaysiensis]NIY68092.1 hypothetical protein [Streptomyces malaysiensis]